MNLSRSPRLPGQIFAVLMIAALSFGPAILHAQETPAEPAPETAPGPSDLSMGTDPSLPPALPTQAEAAEGQTYLNAAFEKWELRCIKTPDGSDPCQLYQLLLDKDANGVAEISMFALPEGGQAVAGATVIAPLETLLTAAMQLSVDGGKPKAYPFNFCTRAGCIARIGFTAEEIAQFKAGAGATMVIVPAVAPDQKVELAVSLKGFTAGYEAVKAANAGQKP